MTAPGALSDTYRQLEALITSFLFVFLVQVILYRVVPYRRLGWRRVLSGAAFAAVLFELGKNGFVFYLNRVANLEAVYGSVSSIIILLLWLYYSARVILLGAALIAVTREEASP